MFQEDAEIYRVIFLVALESQILLKHIDVGHIKADICLFQDFEQLLVTNLLGASSQRLNMTCEHEVLEFYLVFQL